MSSYKVQARADNKGYWTNKVSNSNYTIHTNEEASSEKWSKDEYAVLCHAVETWRKEGREDPMVLYYASADAAQAARGRLEDAHNVQGIAGIGSTLIVEKDAAKLERLYEKERVHYLFLSKLRAAALEWENHDEADKAILLQFMTAHEVSYAKKELYEHFGIQDEAKEHNTILEIPPHYADLVISRLHLGNNRSANKGFAVAS